MSPIITWLVNLSFDDLSCIVFKNLPCFKNILVNSLVEGFMSIFFE